MDESVLQVINEVLESKEQKSVHVADSFKRLQIHEYLDAHHRNLFHKSYLDESKDYVTSIVLTRDCYECDAKKVYLKDVRYHVGSEPSNIDESYYGNCIACGEEYTIDINFDDYWIKVKEKNMIMIGIRI